MATRTALSEIFYTGVAKYYDIGTSFYDDDENKQLNTLY